MNGKTNHGYTFEFSRLPAAASVEESVRRFLADTHEPTAQVTIDHLPDWRAAVARIIEQWLFSFLTDPGGSFSDRKRTFTVSVPWGRRAVIEGVMATLDRVVTPTAVWRVHVETKAFYECGWDDVAFETADAVYLLHLGVSD